MGKTSSTIHISGLAFCHQAAMSSVMPRRQTVSQSLSLKCLPLGILFVLKGSARLGWGYGCGMRGSWSFSVH